MKWESASQFFAMGGYGLYVWGSYVVALVVLAVEVGMARARFRRAIESAPGPEAESDAA